MRRSRKAPTGIVVLTIAIGTVVSAVGSSGCAGWRTIPAPTVSADGPIHLAPDEGILVVHAKTEIGLSRLFLGPYRLERVFPSEFRLVRLKAGHYAWDRADAFAGPRSFLRYELDWVDSNQFDVRAGYINYPGMLVIVRHHDGVRFFARVINRSAAAVRLLEQQFPELLRQLPIRYSGFLRDDFLSTYSEALRGRSE